MTTEMFLVQHGTKAFRLPASAVLSAARSDLQLRKRKHEARLVNLRTYEEIAQQHYAFRHEHVAVAKDVADLLRRALEDEEWKSSAKASVHILYGDRERLREALEAAAA